MKIVIVFLLLSFSVCGQIGLNFGNSFGGGGNNFGGGGSFGNSFGGGSFGGRQQGMSQVGGVGGGMGGLGNSLGNNSGNSLGGVVGGNLGANGGGLNGGSGGVLGNNSGNSRTNNVGTTNNVYRPQAVGVNQRRKDNNGYDYGTINSGPSPMFSGRTFQQPLRRIASGTNSVTSIRQYLRLNSREGQFEANSQLSGQSSGGAGQSGTNSVSVGGPSVKAN